MSSMFHSLSSKVIAIFIALTILSVGALNYMAYVSSNSIFERQTLNSMNSILTFRGDMVTASLAQMESQAVSVAKIEAMRGAGIRVADSPAALGKAMVQALKG